MHCVERADCFATFELYSRPRSFIEASSSRQEDAGASGGGICSVTQHHCKKREEGGHAYGRGAASLRQAPMSTETCNVLVYSVQIPSIQHLHSPSNHEITLYAPNLQGHAFLSSNSPLLSDADARFHLEDHAPGSTRNHYRDTIE